MMKWLVNIANKSLLAITLLVINLWLLINDWSNHAFAGTIDLNANSVNKMTGLDLASNNELKDSTQPTGFLWYNEDLFQTREVIKLDSVVTKQDFTEAPYDQRINKLKQEFSKAQRRALDNPTLANVIIAQRLHKQILEKSHKFATMWQLATVLDHQLSNINEPTNSLHKRLYEEKQGQENDYKLKKLAKNWGLILQIATNCAYCKAFAPIVKQFANKYGFQLIFVGGNEEKFQDVTTVKDTGLLKKLNPENIVPVLYLIASDGRQIYPIARSIVSEDKIINNILTIDQHYYNLGSAEVRHE